MRARPVLGILRYWRTLRFLRAARTHLTTARYGLLAALSRTNAMRVTHVGIAARALSPRGTLSIRSRVVCSARYNGTASCTATAQQTNGQASQNLSRAPIVQVRGAPGYTHCSLYENAA